MISRVACSIFLLVSVVMAQKVMPGTVASTVAPDSAFDVSSSSSSDARQPISAQERIQWIAKGTIGPEGLAGELFGAGWGTLFNTPKTYGTHWQGFGDRLGMSVAGNAVSNTMEAGLGAIWGEDPRYIRDGGASFGHRIGHAAKMTFMAQDRDGKLMPAYARMIASPAVTICRTPGALPATTARIARPFAPASGFSAALATTRLTNFGRTLSKSYSITDIQRNNQYHLE